MPNEKAFLAIKYHPDHANRLLIERLCDVITWAGFDVSVIIRDVEAWGKKIFNPKDLMTHSFRLIGESQVVIVEASEKGVGIGIEVGYACAHHIPIIVIAKTDTEISVSLQGVANQIIFYDEPKQLSHLISTALK